MAAIAVVLHFLLVLLLGPLISGAPTYKSSFTFNGFSGADLVLDGAASITPTGLLRLTDTSSNKIGHAFLPFPIPFRASPSANVSSFSTTFAVALIPSYPAFGGHGLAFVVSPTRNFSSALPSQYLGLLNATNNGDPADHIAAVELDTMQSPEFQDIDANHVGIDINSLISNASHTAGYFDSSSHFHNFTLIAGDPIMVWVEYDGGASRITVTLAPANVAKPKTPLVSSRIDLSTVLLDSMYLGFASSTGPDGTSHYVLGWSFKMNGTAQELDFSNLPQPPKISTGSGGKKHSRASLAIPLSVAGAAIVAVLLCVAAAKINAHWKLRYEELVEDWEVGYAPHRFSYKELHAATSGFREAGLLGVGGFGRVYRGVLPTSRTAVAVKKFSHDSSQGMKEFVAEIVSIGRLRHRNLVQLLGYCRRKGELLLVYDYMSNGSLDKALHSNSTPPLRWGQRFQIVKGLASGLLYLHEEWEKVVVHRDIKSSNVLLDSEWNGRLGDFGLARLYDHGGDPHTTHVVGTLGYLAPELARARKGTTATDVFAFGVLVLELACGRRPIELSAGEEMLLVDWVLDNWRNGGILESRDAKMGDEFKGDQVEMVLKLGLHCAHPLPAGRPSMRKVVQYLEGDLPVPELSSYFLSFSMLELLGKEGIDAAATATATSTFPSSEISGSFLSGPR